LYDNVYKAPYCIVFVNTVRISATLPKDQIEFIRSNSYSASRLLQNVVIDLMKEKKSHSSPEHKIPPPAKEVLIDPL